MGTWLWCAAEQDIELLEQNGYLLVPQGPYIIVQKAGTWQLPEGLKGEGLPWGKTSMKITARGVRGEAKSDKAVVNLSRVEVPDWILEQLKKLK